MSYLMWSIALIIGSIALLKLITSYTNKEEKKDNEISIKLVKNNHSDERYHPYCDSKELEELIYITKPYKGEIFPHEAFALSYIYKRKPRLSTDFEMAWNGFYIYSSDGILGYLINEGYVCIVKDSSVLDHISIKEFRELAKTKNIKCPSNREKSKERILNNFTEKEIVSFYKGYIDLTEKGIQSLEKSSEEIFNKLNTLEINDVITHELKRYEEEKTPYFTIITNILAYQYYSFGYESIMIKCKKNEYVKNVKIIKYDTSAIDCYINNNKVSQYISGTRSVYIDSIKDCNVNIFYKGELILKLKKVIRIYPIHDEKAIIVSEKDKTHKELLLVDLRKKEIVEKSEVKKKENFESTFFECDCDGNDIAILYRSIKRNGIETSDPFNSDDNVKFNNKEYIGFCVSTNNIVGRVIESFSNEVKIKKIKNIDGLSYNNYIIYTKPEEKIGVLVMYMITQGLLHEPFLFGTKLDTLDSFLHYEEPKNHIEELYYDYISNYVIGINMDALKLKLSSCSKENLIEEINNEFELYSNFYYNMHLMRPPQNYYVLRNDILAGNKKYKDMYDSCIYSLKKDGIIPVKWKNEFELYLLVKNKYNDAIFQYRDAWLNKQSLDIYIPSIKTGIEYQGIQHYEAIDYFGGEERFKEGIERDNKKKQLCIENGVKLIEWKYDVDISEENLKILLNNSERR